MCGQVLVDAANTKFHENLSGGNRVVSCRQTVGTAMTRLVVAIRNAKAPRNVQPEKETVTIVRLIDLLLLS
jgi:seryl-tRNA synthetase